MKSTGRTAHAPARVTLVSNSQKPASKAKRPAGIEVDHIRLANYFDGVSILEFWAITGDHPTGCIIAHAYVSTARLGLALAGERMKPR